MLTPSFTPARIRLGVLRQPGTCGTGCIHLGSAGPSAEKGASAYISAQNKRIKTATKTSRGDKFAEGWVLAVISEIQSFALTDDERELMQQWLEHKYPQTQTTRARKPGRSRNGDASRYAGFREGQNVRLHRPVSGQEQQKLEAR